VTTWTPQSGGSTSYRQARAGSVWDGGASLWDVSGNVAQSAWDAGASASWAAQSGGSTTWTEA